MKPEMDTNFCVHWQGDRKAKYCRICAVEDSPCFELWRAVQALASRNFVLVNNKSGRAFGHRYRLEPPRRSPCLCYIQTLQDKRAHFGLPIEDFLYVTRTGLGGMYQTPSRTKQNPFVTLILEQIGDDPQMPNGAKLIEAVRKLPRKNKTN
ncbi:MAG: hypothetical protein NWF05_01700 [Candidatus Bathyarchaeota archaeon]|nr:hypothetical protein [Candidatus Bathyarchaeota archaeon]